MEPKTSRTHLAQGVMFLTISNLTFMVVGYITNIFLGRHLGPELYGVYGVLTSLMTAIGVMGVNGLPQVVSRFAAEDKHQAEAVLASGLRLQAGITLGLALLLAVLAPLGAIVFKDPHFVGYLSAVALVFPFYGLFSLYGGYYNGRRDFRRQALMNIIYSLSKLGLVIGLALIYQIYGIIAGFIIAPIIAMTIGAKWPRPSSLFPYRRLIMSALPLIGFAVLAALSLSIDLLSVKALMSDTAAAGYYAAAQSIALIPYMAMGALGQVLFPHISHLVKTDQRTRAASAISQALRYMMLIVLPAAAVIMSTAPVLVELLFGANYLPSVPVLRIIVLGYAILTVFALFANILNGAGKAKTAMMLAGTGVITTLCLCLCLIPQFGLIGAAFSTVTGATIAAIGAAWFTYREFRFTLPIVNILRTLVASTLLLGVLAVIAPTGVGSLVIALSVAAFVYLTSLGVLREISEEDVSILRTLLTRNKKPHN